MDMEDPRTLAEDVARAELRCLGMLRPLTIPTQEDKKGFSAPYSFYKVRLVLLDVFHSFIYRA